MSRRFSLTVLLFVMVVAWVWADEQHTVKLDNGSHSQAIVELAYGNVFLQLEEMVGGDVAVSVQLENLSESKELLLFSHAYDEKTLKKMPTSIRYDKIFGGTKGTRVIDACKGLNRDVIIYPSQKETLLTLTGNGQNPLVYRLPLYISEYNEKEILVWEKRRYVLLEKQVVELHIEVELKPDEVYVAMSDACRELEEELEDVTFCPNKHHRPSLDEQKVVYRYRIDSLVTAMDSIVDSRGWIPSDKRYQLYEGLKQDLRQIDWAAKEKDCGKHVTHWCKYCNLSLQQIYHKLDDYYQMIYSSNDRKAVKAQVIKDVKALYRCCTDPHCGRHSRAWQRGNEYKSKIVDRYNRINQF